MRLFKAPYNSDWSMAVVSDRLVLTVPGARGLGPEGPSVSLKSCQHIRQNPSLVVVQLATWLLERLSSKQDHKCALQHIPVTLPVGCPLAQAGTSHASETHARPWIH